MWLREVFVAGDAPAQRLSARQGQARDCDDARADVLGPLKHTMAGRHCKRRGFEAETYRHLK